MTTQAKRPPNDRGQGRNSLQGEGKSPVVQLRVSPELQAKVKRNGPDWTREVLESAPEIKPAVKP